MLCVLNKFWSVHKRNERVLYQWLPAMKQPVTLSEQCYEGSLN